jgi:hypothetical protein
MLIRIVKLMTKCALLTLLFLGSLDFLRYLNEGAQRQKFSRKVAAAVERTRNSNDGVEIRLQALTDFAWDRVHIFSPYTSAKRIEEDLGSSWPLAKRIEQYPHDGANILVFTEARKMVFYVEHERHLGDFKGNYKQDGYSPDEAVFKVSEGSKQPNGLTWLYLRWKWREPVI